ncbi:MAG: hypothetical protein CMH22_10625 [Methylophaga sp.]|uniref:hypothetical protein n=1 Tax=Methylophaga sp. UBA678 TaxID=1946901 RepID=UPI000C395930|nr:hypothetical protein [Methylophaga sp. UBA678]MAX52423.1 hypothetical protein [Methylophaga sp.]|tara:strand:- start:150197 stop:150910 length:714 start_codon:yes stop_codon:yes gene_type:complete
MASDKAEELERRSTLFLLVLNLLLTTLGGYYFIGKYQADSLRSESDLAVLNSKLAEVELDTRSTQNSLAVLSGRLNLSSNTLELADMIIPRFDLQYLKDSSYSNKTDHVVAHKLVNTGSLSSRVSKYEVVVTSEPSSEWPPEKDIILSQRFYDLDISDYYVGLLPSEVGKKYTVKLKVGRGYTNKEKKLFVHLLVYYETNPELYNLIINSEMGTEEKNAWEKLTKARLRSTTTIEIL